MDMDIFGVARMIQDGKLPGISIKYGTVVELVSERWLLVNVGMADTPQNVLVERDCSPTVGDRVVILVSKTTWLAVATVSGDKVAHDLSLTGSGTQGDPLAVVPVELPAAMEVYFTQTALAATATVIPIWAIRSQSRAGLMTLSGGILTATRRLYVTGVCSIFLQDVGKADWIAIQASSPMRGSYSGHFANSFDTTLLHDTKTFAFGGVMLAGNTLYITANNLSSRGYAGDSGHSMTLSILPL
jgi:hypothetical protein